MRPSKASALRPPGTGLSGLLEITTHGLANWAATSGGFLTAAASVLLWLWAGQYFHYSTQWENLLQVYIAVVTFLLIFVMQRSQKKELLVLQLKLNELIAASERADNRMINIEQETEETILEVQNAHGQLNKDP